MRVDFYLEYANGERFNYLNHVVTSEKEVDWLIKKVRQNLMEGLEMPDAPKLSLKTVEDVAPDSQVNNRLKGRM